MNLSNFSPTEILIGAVVVLLVLRWLHRKTYHLGNGRFSFYIPKAGVYEIHHKYGSKEFGYEWRVGNSHYYEKGRHMTTLFQDTRKMKMVYARQDWEE